MTRDRWIERCVQRLEKLTNFSAGVGTYAVASALADEQAECFRASGIAWQSPEAVAEREADEELEP